MHKIMTDYSVFPSFQHKEGAMPDLTREEAAEFFGLLFHGRNHSPDDTLKPIPRGGWKIIPREKDFASYGYDALTRLCFLAHDHCIRASIVPGNRAGILQINIWRRSRIGGMNERHPTIEAALATWRETHPRP